MTSSVDVLLNGPPKIVIGGTQSRAYAVLGSWRNAVPVQNSS